MKTQKIKILIITLLCLNVFYGIDAQISINTDNSAPDNSAMLDVKSINKGILIPRLTSLERSNIVTPAEGLLIFDTDTKSFWNYNGTSWVNGVDYDWLKTDGSHANAIGNSIYTNGNVGIGTSSPSFPIDVQGTGGERLRAYSTDDYYAGLIAKNSSREFFVGVQATFETNDASSGFHIYDNTAGARRFVIDKDGDVGINQSNPNARLHVNGDFRLVDGTQGLNKVLTSDASGFASWILPTDNVNDADADPANEIELPSGGSLGQYLQTNGSGGYTWATPTDNSFWSLNGNDIYNNNVSNKVGIGNTSPQASLDVSGTIIAGASTSVINSTTLNGSEGLLMPGSSSDYIIGVQDGNGRIQHKWNASYGTNETFIVGAEDAAFLDFNANASTDNDAWIEFKHANGLAATAGDVISWNTHMIINQAGEVGINEISPDDMLHVTDGGNGTRIRSENSGNGWAGFLSKNTVGEIYMGLQGSFDPNPGEFHIYDNVANTRRFVIDATGNVGIGKNNPNVKLDVNGSVNCTGGTCSSDIRWKKDIMPLENTLKNVLELKGVSYDWRRDEFPSIEFSEVRQIGLIAQEVEKIYPELIMTDNEGFKSMDYMSFTAVLLEAVKELKSEKDLLESEFKNQIEKLSAEIEELKKDKSQVADLKLEMENIKSLLLKD